MRRALLDSSAYTAFTRGHPGVEQALRRVREIYLNPVVVGELQYGFRWGSRREKNESLFEQFRSSRRVDLVPIDEDTSGCYVEISLALRRAGRPIPTNDIWIAASALQHGLGLITTDQHFLAVPQVIIDFHEP